MKSLRVRLTPTCLSTRLLAAAVLACAAAGAHAADGDTLKKIKDTGVISLGYRESSIPSRTTRDGKEVMGYSHEILLQIVDKIKTTLNMPNLQVKLTPITSQNRISLMQNGTIDIECGSTTNNLERQKQVAFSNSLFVYGIKMLTKKDSGVTDFAQLKGRNVVTTAGTTGERLLVKMNAEQGMNIEPDQRQGPRPGVPDPGNGPRGGLRHGRAAAVRQGAHQGQATRASGSWPASRSRPRTTRACSARTTPRSGSWPMAWCRT